MSTFIISFFADIKNKEILFLLFLENIPQRKELEPELPLRRGLTIFVRITLASKSFLPFFLQSC
jgi:hypothetical protein